jgi:hypothetical protein
MADKVEVVVRKKGFWTLTAEGTQTLTLPSGTVFNAGTIAELPKNIREHLLEYGFRQKLADAGAVGKDAPESDRIDGMNKRLVQLRSGDMTRANAGKGAVKISKESLGKLSKEELALLEKITGRKLG